MCGIAGIVNLKFEKINQSDLDLFNELLTHRGPDNKGFYNNNNVGLSHTRLSILDLSVNGNQPMQTKDKRYVISYNGEIYNFREIRSELESKGYKFSSNTDTEVILYAWQEWGKESVNFFNGMFAISILDNSKNEIYLIRDRYGIKPIYYYMNSSVFIFASEQKAITKSKYFNSGLNYQSFVEYFTFQNIFSNNTLYDNVKILNPGCILKFEFNDNPKITISSYWDFEFNPENKKDNAEYGEELENLIEQSILLQSKADVEVGSYLSGGIDTSLIVYYLSKHQKNIKTFTCGFDMTDVSNLELMFDERKAASIISKKFNTNPHEIIIDSTSMLKCLEKLCYHLEEPRVGQSYPNYYISSLASKNLKVVMSGVGADEIFGGYPWRYNIAKSNSENTFLDSYYNSWQRLLKFDSPSEYFSPVKNEVSQISTKDIFLNVFKKYNDNFGSFEKRFNACLYFEAKTFMHGLLVNEDKISMAHSLETRLPYLDNNIVDFALKCPINLKIDKTREIKHLDENISINKKSDYLSNNNNGKIILRNIAKKFIGSEVATARKQGFSSPDSNWFKNNNSKYIQDIINNPKSPIFNIIDQKKLKKKWSCILIIKLIKGY